jgi:hypothetical protein
MFDKAREYAANAREAVDLAARMSIGDERAALLHMAETWLLLAEAALEHARFMEPAVREPGGEAKGGQPSP